MPNRWVREDAIESESVNAASWLAEVFWRRLLNRCDDFGRFTANLTLLRTKIFPLQMDKVSEADLARLLSECETVGLLFTYTGGDGKPYLALNKFEKGRAKSSKYPDPPEDVCKRMKTFAYRCMQTQTNAPTSDPDYRLPTSDPDAEGERPPDEAVIPTVDEIANYCAVGVGIPRDYCEDYHAKKTIRNGWIVNGRMIQWRIEIARWWVKDRATWGQKNGNQTASKPQSTPSSLPKPKGKVL